jgi:hypothetical protein
MKDLAVDNGTVGSDITQYMLHMHGVERCSIAGCQKQQQVTLQPGWWSCRKSLWCSSDSSLLLLIRLNHVHKQGNQC